MHQKPLPPNLLGLVTQDGSMFPYLKSMWLKSTAQNILWKMSVQDCYLWRQTDGTLQLSLTVSQVGILASDLLMILTIQPTELDFPVGHLILPTLRLYFCTSILMFSERLSPKELELTSVVFVDAEDDQSIGFIVK